MRTIIVALTIVLFLIVSLPLLGIMCLIGLFNKHACAAGSQAVIRWIFKIVLWETGAKITVKGVENIPTDRPVLFAGDHKSYADIPLAYTTLPVLTGFLAKKEIKKVPGLSWWMMQMNNLFLDRHDVRKDLKVILEAIERVKQGYSIFVMPEGTRNHSDELLPFKDGCFKIAEKTGCPVVPVAISNSDAIYELHTPWIKKAKVAIHYGEPIYVDQMSREEVKQLSSMVRSELERMLEEDKQYVE